MSLSKILTASAVLFAIVVRICFFISQYYIIFTIDGYNYYDKGYDFRRAITLSNSINPHRAPGYPIVISAVMRPKYALFVDQREPNFVTREQYLMVLQHMAGIGGIICLFLLLKRVHLHEITKAVILLFYGIYTPLISMERMFCTEIFATFFLLLSVLLLVNKKVTWFIIASGILFLFRPFYIGIPLILAGITGLYATTTRQKISWILIGLFTLIVPAIYFIGNQRLHDFNGISQASTINVMGRILQYPFTLPTESIDDRYLSGAVQEFRKSNTTRMPYQFIDTYLPGWYDSPKTFQRLHAYTSKTLRMNFIPYLYYSVLDIPKTFISEPSDAKLYFSDKTLPSTLIAIASILSRSAHLLTIILIPAGVFWIIATIRHLFLKRKLPPFSVTIFIAVVAYSVVLTILDEYEDFGRLTISTIGISMILTGMVVEYTLHQLKRYTAAFYPS